MSCGCLEVYACDRAYWDAARWEWVLMYLNWQGCHVHIAFGSRVLSLGRKVDCQHKDKIRAGNAQRCKYSNLVTRLFNWIRTMYVHLDAWNVHLGFESWWPVLPVARLGELRGRWRRVSIWGGVIACTTRDLTASIVVLVNIVNISWALTPSWRQGVRRTKVSYTGSKNSNKHFQTAPPLPAVPGHP